MLTHIFGDRRHAWAFWLGCSLVTAGVILHLPMYWMARNKGFHLAGMVMDAGMLWGMASIVGVALTAFGLVPRRERDPGPAGVFAPPEEAGPGSVSVSVPALGYLVCVSERRA